MCRSDWCKLTKNKVVIAIHVVGIGLDGAVGLTAAVQQIVEQAALLVGSDRHLSYFPNHAADRLVLTDFNLTIAQLHNCLVAPGSIVILTSGDPLFFGLGRLLLAEFPPEQLTFHPHVSSLQLAFSRIKLPWQDAQLVSAHGRSLDALIPLLQQGVEKIAVLTDSTNTPGAIAHLLSTVTSRYQIWVCENLGGAAERIVTTTDPASLQTQTFAPLNVVVLRRLEQAAPLDLTKLPLLGIADEHFLSFSDRPGLITKREVRVQILAELKLQPHQVIWDIGSGTGSVAIEIARLVPSAQVYAIEKTAIGFRLLQQNCQRFQIGNVQAINGTAPEILATLPAPDRIFIGGSGGNLSQILDLCHQKLAASGRMVLALTTLEHLNGALTWLAGSSFKADLLQVQLSRSVPIANLTRFAPMNPITLVALERSVSLTQSLRDIQFLEEN